MLFRGASMLFFDVFEFALPFGNALDFVGERVGVAGKPNAQTFDFASKRFNFRKPILMLLLQEQLQAADVLPKQRERHREKNENENEQ